jgi:acylphosphatase
VEKSLPGAASLRHRQSLMSDEAQSTPEGREIWISGHVQGVGFRYTTSQIAREFEVTGTVRNLADGRVHLCVEGQRAEIDAFLEQLRTKMDGFIRDEQARPFEASGQYRGFQIVG